MEPESQPTGEPAGLSRRARAVVAAVAGAVATAVLVHTGIVFFYIAPSNVVSEKYATEIYDYMAPELLQNWALFAPEPLHVNRSLHARARVKTDEGTVNSEWIDLTAIDVAGTRGNLLPSHTRNQLRKGWRTFTNTHNADHEATSMTGLIIESYLKRVALMRMSHHIDGEITEVQLRSATSYVPEPAWSDRSTTDDVSYTVLPWWPVSEHDFPEGSRR
ncbi:DUF5819 family protein [Haloechinothrix halophila]|uniref:DUF5819 family protein n=1 Tax=Haloechinothrix halophila TaxID=1069073 RepID=UPI000427E30C|nr:DUF5819 family protein [Haloechinothrix halophila]